MTIDDALALADYHYWARDRMLDAVAALTPEQYTRDLGSSFPSVHDTVVHTYSAEWVWYSRWTGHSPTAVISPDAFPGLDAVRRAWSGQEEKVKLLVGILGAANELSRVFRYRLMNGTEAESAFSHMLQHLVNHASYHRGQITTMLRQLGAPAPKPQDLIHFYRERLPKVH